MTSTDPLRDDPEAAPDGRRPGRWIPVLAIAGVAALVLGAVAVALTGWSGLANDHRSATTALAAAEKRLSSVDGGLTRGTTVASASVTIADDLAALDLTPYADASSLDSLGAAANTTEQILEAATKRSPVAIPAARAGLFWPGDIAADTARLSRGIDRVSDSTDEGKRLITSLRASARKVEKTGLTVVTAVAESLPAMIGAYPSARNTARDALHRAADLLDAPIWTHADADVGAYLHAVADLQATQDAELAEKRGSLLDRRLAAEEYARSLSGGVMLDFDWADIVIGYGQGDSMAGTAEGSWYSPDEAYSTITLTNSIAEYWNDGSDRSRSLVAHEVGHAIHPKCFAIYPDDDASEEQWATAWSISWGHTSEATGTQAYGQPSEALIATAATCR